MNYTLKEIKEELLKEIAELEERDPSWKNCRKCPFKGKCCLENDIDIREDEWQEISSLLDKDSFIRSEVYKNYLADSRCYFHTEEKCLIAPIRPTNCLYTPYQLIQNVYSGDIEYSLRDEDCFFVTKEEKSNSLLPLDSPFIERGGHTYLFLNYWFTKYENQSEGTYKLTGKERLDEYFSDPKKRTF